MATAVTAGLDLAETASGDDSGLNDWIDANSDLADSAQDMADIAIPAYTKSGDAAAASSKKTKTAAQKAASAVESYSDTVTEILGKVTRTTQTTNELLSDGTRQQKKSSPRPAARW